MNPLYDVNKPMFFKIISRILIFIGSTAIETFTIDCLSIADSRW